MTEQSEQRPDGGADLEAICRQLDTLLSAAGSPLRRLRVQMGESSVELEWPGPPGLVAPAVTVPGAAGVAAAGVPVAAGIPGPALSLAAQNGAAETTGPATAADEDPAPDDRTCHVRAPLVGTFYHSPEPGKPPFIEPGDLVAKGDRIGILEAMKLMNPVEADVSGRVIEILAEDGAAVEYDQPLVAIEPESDADAETLGAS